MDSKNSREKLTSFASFARATLEVTDIVSGICTLYGFFEAYVVKRPVGINIIAFLIVFIVSLLLMYAVEKGFYKWFRTRENWGYG